MIPQTVRQREGKKPSLEEIEGLLDRLHNDPELMEIARKFVRRHGGRFVE